jgi:hypothetical protein
MKLLLESKQPINEGIVYHKNTNTPLNESIYRYGSQKYFEMFSEARRLWIEGRLITENAQDLWFLKETNLGERGRYNGKEVYLDFPYLMEAEHDGKDVELNKPKKGGPKKFYVYVKDGDKVKKVTWGDTTGLKVKINNLDASKSFAARHKCDTEKDKTSANWWACNLPKYAKQLGLSEPAYRYW